MKGFHMDAANHSEKTIEKMTATNKAGTTQSKERMKDFIKSSVNPDNNAFFAERSNHLSSKGD